MSKRKMKLTPEKRVMLVENYLNGEESLNGLAHTVDISVSTLRNWLMIYENEGSTGLLVKRNEVYH